MMNRVITVLAAAIALASCSEPERLEQPAPAAATTRVTLLQQGDRAVTVYAYRQQGDVFLFDTLFSEGWTAQGRMHVRMVNGRYKFLFAAGAGENVSLTPVPVAGATAWEQAAFALRRDPASTDASFPPDELFLQAASDAEAEYTLDGREVTIPARLTRAVAQIGITLKRGYHDGERYVEVPYLSPQSVVGQIGRIDIRAEGTGMRTRPQGSEGQAVVCATCSTADGRLTEGGFVTLDGPFILPPAQGGQIELLLTLTPAAGSALQPAQVRLTGRAERNKRLEVTLWITSAYPTFGVEISQAPIEREQEGDSGIWE